MARSSDGGHLSSASSLLFESARSSDEGHLSSYDKKERRLMARSSGGGHLFLYIGELGEFKV